MYLDGEVIHLFGSKTICLREFLYEFGPKMEYDVLIKIKDLEHSMFNVLETYFFFCIQITIVMPEPAIKNAGTATETAKSFGSMFVPLGSGGSNNCCCRHQT